MNNHVRFIRTILLLSTFVLSTFTFAQSIMTGNGRYEVGVAVGPTFFLGDVGGGVGKGSYFIKDVNLSVTKVSKGIYFNAYPAEWIGFRVALNQGYVEGADSLIHDKGGMETYRKQRNLSFRSPILEFYAAAELYPTVLLEREEELQGKFRPYSLLGIGIFRFNPQAQYKTATGQNTWVNLRPLHLEGQGMTEYPNRKQYSNIAVEVPMGAGFKYYLSDKMYIGAEVLHRKTFTDYVDDVSATYIDPGLFQKYLSPDQAVIARQLYDRRHQGSNGAYRRTSSGEQRGNPKNNDSFFSTVLRFGWRLDNLSSAYGRARKQLRCPVF